MEVYEKNQPLADFQTSLSGKNQAKITIPVVDKVFETISTLDDIKPSELSRVAGVHGMTGNRYVRGESSPKLNVAVRMLHRLGYDLYLVKKA